MTHTLHMCIGNSPSLTKKYNNLQNWMNLENYTKGKKATIQMIILPKISQFNPYINFLQILSEEINHRVKLASLQKSKTIVPLF